MSLAELEMLLGNRDGALSVLVSGAENFWEGYFTPTSLRLLRAKKEYSAQISHLLTTKFFKESLESNFFTQCKIYNGLLLEYLSSENISSVLKQIQTYSLMIQDSKFLEKLYELECKFLHHYAVSSFGGYKPGLIRDSLEEIIEKFPDNTLFLSMQDLYLLIHRYGWNEQKSSFENRLRRILDLNLSKYII